MNRIDYYPVQTLLALENKVVRIGLRESFKQSGFTDFTEIYEAGNFFKVLEEAPFDLMIISGSIGGTSTVPMISAMRDGRLQHHPFPIVVMLLTEGDANSIGEAIAAGPDHLMVLPVAPGPMLKRIEEFAVRRNPFVVTMAYVGPDRRTAPRPGCAPAPHVTVPNPLAASIRNSPLGERQSEIDLTRLQISTIKLQGYAGCLLSLENVIRMMFQQKAVEAGKLAFFSRCLRRIAGTLPSCFGDLCLTEADPRIMGSIADLTNGVEVITQVGLAIDRQRLDGILAECQAVAAEFRRMIEHS